MTVASRQINSRYVLRPITACAADSFVAVLTLCVVMCRDGRHKTPALQPQPETLATEFAALDCVCLCMQRRRQEEPGRRVNENNTTIISENISEGLHNIGRNYYEYD